MTLDAALRDKRKAIQPISRMDVAHAAKACTALAQSAREAAENTEAAWLQLEQTGVLVEAIRYAKRNGIELPPPNVAEAARTLRAYAGTIFLYAASLQRARETEFEVPPECIAAN